MLLEFKGKLLRSEREDVIVSIHVSEVFFLSVASGLACCSFRWLFCSIFFYLVGLEGLALSFTLFFFSPCEEGNLLLEVL